MTADDVAKDFPIVCVGGSASGLDAYIRLLRHLPPDVGVAVVIVNHQRTLATQLHELLPSYIRMPVELISEGLVLEPNHVFIIPGQRDLHVLDGEFRLKPISKPRGWPDVITVFLHSLTLHWKGTLIAVIVSDMTAMAQRRCATSRREVASPSRRSLKRKSCRTCPKVQSPADVSI